MGTTACSEEGRLYYLCNSCNYVTVLQGWKWMQVKRYLMLYSHWHNFIFLERCETSYAVDAWVMYIVAVRLYCRLFWTGASYDVFPWCDWCSDIINSVVRYKSNATPHNKSTTSALICVIVSVMPERRLKKGSGVSGENTLQVCCEPLCSYPACAWNLFFVF